MCVWERKVGEVHVARESKEASAARDIDAALSPRTPPAPCDLARGKTRPAWARDTTIHSVCVCARVLMWVSKSLFTCLLCAICPKRGKNSKNNAFYLSIEPLPRNLFWVPVHCINVRHINTEQNQEETWCGMISYCGNLVCLIWSNSPIIFLSKMKFVQKSRWKMLTSVIWPYSWSQLMTSPGWPVCTTVSTVGDLKKETQKDCRYVWSQIRVYWSWLATMLPDLERLFR